MVILTQFYSSNRRYTPEELAEIHERLDAAIEQGAYRPADLVNLLAERAMVNLNTGNTDAAEPDLRQILQLTADGQPQQVERCWALGEIAAMEASLDRARDSEKPGQLSQ